MHKCETFIHPGTGKWFDIKYFLMCNSDWIINVLCHSCMLLYVGETTCYLKTCLNNHRYTIRKSRMDLPVSKHFAEYHHTEWDLSHDCWPYPSLEKGGDRLLLLKKRELQWIYQLQTLRPNGLNVDYKVLKQMVKWSLPYSVLNLCWLFCFGVISE